MFRNLQEPFIWMAVSYAIFPTMNRQKMTNIAGMTAVKKLLSPSGIFEDTV